ncbi:MAG: glutamate cyclase domain-containing protein [Bacillota bacterium]
MRTFEEQRILHLGQAIDNLMTCDLHARGILKPIYEVMVDRIGEPLSTFAAKRFLEVVKPGSYVIIGTGFLIKPSMKIETDGPVAAALLARMVTVLGAIPVIVAEENCYWAIEPACKSAELNVYYDIEQATNVHHSVALVPMPQGEKADAIIEQILKLNPSAMIIEEHPGKGPDGKYYSALATELPWAAPVDDLFEAVRNQGGLGIAIGDLGNEAGMGFAKPEIDKIVPRGEYVISVGSCDCPIIATITELGCYAFMAAVEAVSKVEGILQSPELTEIVLRAAVIGGSVEGCWGLPIPAIDMVDIKYIKSYVNMLACIVKYSEVHGVSRSFFVNYARGAALDAPTDS